MRTLRDLTLRRSTFRHARLSALLFACGLLAAAPAPTPAAPGDGSANWLGVLRLEGGAPIPVSLHLGTISGTFYTGTYTLRPVFLQGCPVCPTSCSPWTGLVTGKFDAGSYVLTMQFPTKDLLTCEVQCLSTMDVVLEFEANGSMSGTGFTHACDPLQQDQVSHWRLKLVP